MLNFASTGFIMAVETSIDPNQTVSENPLPSLPPSLSYLTSKAKAVCQPVSLPVGTQFFTNQTALKYTLTGVWEESKNGSGRIISPSLTYFQNVLDDCSVTSIQIDVESQDRAVNQLALTEWGAKVRTYATCRIAASRGAVFFNLTQIYDYVPDTTNLNQFVLGESLMSTYWAQTTFMLQNETRYSQDKQKYPIRKGNLLFVPQPQGVDITNTGFFRFSSQFIEATSPGRYEFPHVKGETETLEDLIRQKAYPNIWRPADNLAKSVYSTILADLGQMSKRPNVLTDAPTLQQFSSNLSEIQKPMANARPGPATQSYDELKHITGPLAINPSVISAQYVCQVPRLRSTGSLVVALLVADLVFLKAAWSLYTLTAGWWLGRQARTSAWCRGCLEMGVGGGGLGGTPVSVAPEKPYVMLQQRDLNV
ncbi:hypothetical protein PG999_003160 [Apiospora kogelbergensis]|uniref:Uncharacterized protein n=1 Tax=Apiospora kogelbergensis TaxID=1337665 RepID=A0AAW0RAE2_9PEZI